MTDSETLTALRGLAASEVALPVALADWLKGETIGEIRADAKAWGQQLGLVAADRVERDDGGRFAATTDMNAALRAAAGRRL